MEDIRINKKSRIVITGATGFIGKNLVEAFHRKHDLVSLVRSTSSKENIDFLKGKCRIFYGDITEKKSLKGLIRKDDIIIHIAGIKGNPLIKKRKFIDTHIRGTRNLLGLCSGQKFIHISSAGVLGPVDMGNEKSPVRPSNIYEKTKAEAEKIVRGYDNHMILRPEFLYGPFDMHVLRLFRSIKKKRFFILGDGKSLLHPTFIGDLVECVKICLEKDFNNETFIVAGERAVSVKEFVDLIAETMYVSYNNIHIPLALARVFSGIAEPLGKLFSIDTILTGSRIDFFSKTRTFNTTKARKILGFNPIVLEYGIEQTTGWYRKNGYL